jgi:hypothetical protein
LGWVANELELIMGVYHNKNWGASLNQIAELDTYTNQIYNQTINLKKGVFRLFFDWAAR